MMRLSIEAGIPAHFEAGKVYTVTGNTVHDIKQVSDIILKMLGKDDRLVEYKTGDPSSPLVENLPRQINGMPQTTLEEGIAKTIEWQKKIYGI